MTPKGFDKSDRKRLKMCVLTFSPQVDKEIVAGIFKSQKKDIPSQLWSLDGDTRTI